MFGWGRKARIDTFENAANKLQNASVSLGRNLHGVTIDEFGFEDAVYENLNNFLVVSLGPKKVGIVGWVFWSSRFSNNTFIVYDSCASGCLFETFTRLAAWTKANDRRELTENKWIIKILKFLVEKVFF